MKEKKLDLYKKITEYPNLIGAAAFMAVTGVQTVLFAIWMCSNFTVKGLGCTLLMGASLFFLIKIITDRVVKKEGKTLPYLLLITVYIITIPTVVSVNFHASMFGLCATLLALLVLFTIMYFYGEHDKRLVVLVCMFADLCALGYLNRPAFWAGIGETMVFLSIQLYRNLRTKRNNISDKSWRNTLLLFLILVIIMLLPQYFRFNGIKAVRYEKTASEQLAARVIVPYLSVDKFEYQERYLLGVIKENEYDPTHGYRNFNNLMARYEADGLDMDMIWKNLYRNTYYKYRNRVAKQYIKDIKDNILAPFLLSKSMNNSTVESHHGYYYGLFQNNNPLLSDRYMKFGLAGLFGITVAIVMQAVGSCILDIVNGKYKKKLEEGRHRRIEAIILVIVAGFCWTLFQTLFSLAGASYVVGIYATITWMLIPSFIWFRKDIKN